MAIRAQDVGRGGGLWRELHALGTSLGEEVRSVPGAEGFLKDPTMLRLCGSSRPRRPLLQGGSDRIVDISNGELCHGTHPDCEMMTL